MRFNIEGITFMNSLFTSYPKGIRVWSTGAKIDALRKNKRDSQRLLSLETMTELCGWLMSAGDEWARKGVMRHDEKTN